MGEVLREPREMEEISSLVTTLGEETARGGNWHRQQLVLWQMRTDASKASPLWWKAPWILWSTCLRRPKQKEQFPSFRTNFPEVKTRQGKIKCFREDELINSCAWFIDMLNDHVCDSVSKLPKFHISSQFDWNTSKNHVKTIFKPKKNWIKTGSKPSSFWNGPVPREALPRRRTAPSDPPSAALGTTSAKSEAKPRKSKWDDRGAKKCWEYLGMLKWWEDVEMFIIFWEDVDNDELNESEWWLLLLLLCFFIVFINMLFYHVLVGSWFLEILDKSPGRWQMIEKSDDGQRFCCERKLGAIAEHGLLVYLWRPLLITNPLTTAIQHVSPHDCRICKVQCCIVM